MSFFRTCSLNSSPGRQLLAKAAQRGLCPQMVLFVFIGASHLPQAEPGCPSEPNTPQTLFAFGSIVPVMALEASRAGEGGKAEEDSGGRKSCRCPFFSSRDKTILPWHQLLRFACWVVMGTLSSRQTSAPISIRPRALQ